MVIVHLIFNDGMHIKGRTYREVEDALRAAQWGPYPSRHAFRQEMRRRAVLSYGKRTVFSLVPTSKRFLHSLANTGMCRIERTKDGRLI